MVNSNEELCVMAQQRCRRSVTAAFTYLSEFNQLNLTVLTQANRAAVDDTFW